MTPPLPRTIGVIGAGIMGAGIAQVAAGTGARVLLHDPVGEALQAGTTRVEDGLARMVRRGRLDAAEAQRIRARVIATPALAALSACELVIEAAPEQLELKRELFAALAGVVDGDCVLATNTSSLSVTEIAAAVPSPARVVGMHFFNPAPVMKLVEVVAGQASSPEALARVRAVAEAMGKRVIDAPDIAGFLVNRCNRPYSLAPARLLQERIATTEQIDRIARLEGGFPMGPFELIDMIGLDTNHASARMLFRQTFGEPRYQPSVLQARLVAAGRLGRKTGSGWYSYEDGREHRPPDPEPPPGGGGDGRAVLITGELPVALELADAARAVGFSVAERSPWLTLVCDASPVDGPRARLLHDGSLHLLDPEAAGFHVVPPLSGARLIEVTSTSRTDPVSAARLAEFVGALGRHAEPVADVPGLVLGRIVCQLINEAAFLIGEGHARPADIDAGLELGTAHPRGPVAWSRALGLEHVVGVLAALHRELGEERYRVAPELRRRLAAGERGL